MRHPRLEAKRTEVSGALRALDGVRGSLATPQSVLERCGGTEALSVAFVTDAELAALHARFMADPSPTDVITFPAESGLGVAGEVCVSADAAVRVAGNGPRFSRELTLYLVHGWLHLAGHDDRDPAARRRMRRAEAHALDALRRARALPAFRMRGCPGGRSR